MEPPTSWVSRWPQVLAALAATISSVSDGIQYSWSSPVVPKLMAPDSPMPTTTAEAEWLELLFMLGGIAGLPVVLISVDKLGRKKSILLAAINNFTAWMLIAFGRTVETLLVARFMAGLGADVAFVSVPMYIGELASKEIRGFLTSFISIMVLIGVLLCYSIAPFVSVRDSALVGSCFVLAQLILLPFMPETPYYHLLKGKKDKAEESLKWSRRRTDVLKELEEIQAAVERQSSERGTFKDLIMVKSNRKAIIIMTVLNAAQHFSGISVIMMNLHSILKEARGILDPNIACIIFAVIMLISGLIGSTVIDRFGRKVLLICSSLLAAVALGSLSVYFTFMHHSYDTQTYNWVPILAVYVYAAAFRSGMGLVPIVITGEIFPTSVKAKGMTVSDAMFVIFASITIYKYQVLEYAVGIHAPFYIFAVCCVLTAIFVGLYVPETKGKTLEQIQMILKEEDEETKRSSVI